MFAYCGNNPINRVDPTGDLWFEIIALTVIVVATLLTLTSCDSKDADSVDDINHKIDYPTDDQNSIDLKVYVDNMPRSKEFLISYTDALADEK